MNRKIVRTHDSLYLNENRYDDPKKIFIQIGELIREYFLSNHDDDGSGKAIVDVGCAAGEFAYYLNGIFPKANISGYDLLPELIDKAKKKVSNASFYSGSILDQSIIETSGYDVVTCTGVLPIFDQFEPVISNLLKWSKPGGGVYIHSLFNEHPVDVLIKYCLSEDYGANIYESGWNIFSKNSISTWLDKKIEQGEVSRYKWHDFVMPIDLAKQQDVIRSWTEKDSNKKRILTNGLCLNQPHGILEIYRK